LRRFHIDRLCFPEAVSEAVRALLESEEGAET
jgi:hypothetical protein